MEDELNEIINLEDIKKKEKKSEDICNAAAEIYSNVLILGETKDGQYQMMSSFKDERDILWHMEFAKFHFLNNSLTKE